MKKIIILTLALVMTLSAFASCGNRSNSQIYVISREEGSGTRGAFSELFGVVDENGIDAITGAAEKVTSTATVISTVMGNKNAIGYISLGSLGEDVKALNIDGVSPTVENVRGGSYKIVRPFNICYKDGQLSAVAADFVSFIMSREGQQIITDKDYIAANTEAESYNAKGLVGKVTLAGSTSVSPVMEKLADAYKKLNPGVEIEVQQSGSGAGIQAAGAGACDIGMSSRDLKASELETLKSVKIADDGIVVIVNKENEFSSLTSEQIKNIYLGNIKDWSEIGK